MGRNWIGVNPPSPPLVEGSEGGRGDGGRRNAPLGGMPMLKVLGGHHDPDPKPVKSTAMNLGQKAAWCNQPWEVGVG